MTDATTLRELLERVKAATGPDRRLDAEIMVAVEGGRIVEWSGVFPGKYWDRNNGHATALKLTASIDAAVALVWRVLPGLSLRMSYSEGLRHPNVGMGRSYPTNLSVCVEHHTMPLAILAALLSALITQSEASARAGQETHP